MTPPQLDAAVAEAIQYQKLPSCQLPPYSTDLNLINDAVCAWATTPERKRAYLQSLSDIMLNKRWDAAPSGLALWPVVNATARDRCLALTAAAAKEGSDG